MIEGVFLQELKNRFLCEVRLDDHTVECYIPSSCRLSNFADFSGCKVLLNETSGKKARTTYSLYAIKYKRNFLLVDLKETNRIVESALKTKRFSFLGKRRSIQREVRFGAYKSDFYIQDTNTVVEVKSVLSTKARQPILVVHSDRAISQLKEMGLLLGKGYSIVYIFIALNPATESLIFPKNSGEYSDQFFENLDKGMQCKAYTVRIKNGCAIIDKEIPIDFSEEK